MNYTDENIPIICGECQHLEDGLMHMYWHILCQHVNYDILEAKDFAKRWMQDAYDREEEFEKAYHADRKIEKGVHNNEPY